MLARYNLHNAIKDVDFRHKNSFVDFWIALTREAYDQGALLSYEDLAILLTTSPATIKRDIRHLKNDGKFIMTRGAKHDMGPSLSHKTQIIVYQKGNCLSSAFLSIVASH